MWLRVLSVLFLAPPIAAGQPQTAPELVYPTDGGFRYIDEYYSWVTVDEAPQYRVQVAPAGQGFETPTLDSLFVNEEGADVERLYLYDSLEEGAYDWRVAAVTTAGMGPWSEVASFESRFPVPTEGGPATHELGLRLGPNPTGGTVTVSFEASVEGDVEVAVFDVLGREVVTLVDGVREPGTHVARLDASALAPGTYVVRLATRVGSRLGETRIRRLSVVR